MRIAARALILDPDNRVLLVRFEFPDEVALWAMPGGGVDDGETHEEAIVRELEAVGYENRDLQMRNANLAIYMRKVAEYRETWRKHADGMRK